MAQRQLYCVVALPTRVEFQGEPGTDLRFLPPVPTVTGPFKTTVAARKAGEADWGEAADVRWIVVPLFGYTDTNDKQISLVYDRLLDPALRSRCFACKQTIAKEKEDVA